MSSSSQKCFVIAEAGVNHNGKLSLALDLIDAAKDVGADAVKFQTYWSENLVTQTAERAAYQKANMKGGAKTQYEMLKELELSFSDFKKLKEHCKKRDILFLSTPFDEVCAEFLVQELQMEQIKVSSGDATNLPFLKKLASYDRPILLSTGMCTLEEVKTAVTAIKGINPKIDLTLFHCTSNYPCAFEEANLRAIETLKKTFHTEIGYSDHTLGIEAALAAYTLGAVAIEKHLTLDPNMEGPDHRCSLAPQEFGQLVKGLRHLEKAMGTGVKEPAPSEAAVMKVARKSVVVIRALKRGEVLSKTSIAIKRPGTGITPADIDKIVGMRVKSDLSPGEVLTWNDLEN